MLGALGLAVCIVQCWPIPYRVWRDSNRWNKPRNKTEQIKKRRSIRREKLLKWKQNTGYQEMRKPGKKAGFTEIMWRDLTPKQGVRPTSLWCHFLPNPPACQGAQEPKEQSSKARQRSWRASDWSLLLPGSHTPDGICWLATHFSEPKKQSH